MGGLTANIFCPCVLWLPRRISESETDLGDNDIQPSPFTEAQRSKAACPVLTNSWPGATALDCTKAEQQCILTHSGVALW